MKMIKLLILLIASVAAFAQEADHYIASASTTALTIQQPASNARQISFNQALNEGVSVYCASASTATFSWNGTAATATAGAEIKLPFTQRASGMTVWTGSNVGGGQTGPIYNVPAGSTMSFSLASFKFGTQGTTANLTITTSNACTITFSYSAV